MAGICGRQKADGGQCQRPPGCRIPHGSINSAADAANALIARSPLTDSDFNLLPTRLRDAVVDPLHEVDPRVEMVFDPPDLRGRPMDAERLMRELLGGKLLRGFTLSPHGVGATRIQDGSHAVALPGSDIPLPLDDELANFGYPSKDTIDVIDDWLTMMGPVLESGTLGSAASCTPRVIVKGNLRSMSQFSSNPSSKMKRSVAVSTGTRSPCGHSTTTILTTVATRQTHSAQEKVRSSWIPTNPTTRATPRTLLAKMLGR